MGYLQPRLQRGPLVTQIVNTLLLTSLLTICHKKCRVHFTLVNWPFKQGLLRWNLRTWPGFDDLLWHLPLPLLICWPCSSVYVRDVKFRRAKMYWNWSLKNLRFVPIYPIWGPSAPYWMANLTSVVTMLWRHI